MSYTSTLAVRSPIVTSIAFDPLAVESAKTEAIAELNELQGSSIDNDAELDEAAAMLVTVVQDRKAIEVMRDGLRAPLKAAQKAVDALFAPALQAKEATERKLRALVGGYQQLKAVEQRKQIAAAVVAAEARKPAELTTALVAASAAAPEKLAGVGFREVWAVKRISPDLVPLTWCIPDAQRIAAHARTTPIDQEPAPIPGVIFERVASTTVRS